MSVQHIATQDAYNQWASVYDTDGNMLQAIDDLELEELLPNILNLGLGASDHLALGEKLELIDLGCGTGRNTAKLLAHPWARAVIIRAMDFSSSMLAVAKEKLLPLHEGNELVELMLNQAECFPTVADKSASPIPNVQGLRSFDILISTLVLEHIPLRDYFATLAALVKKGGYALVSNMHSEMGQISQAGFVNAEGIKVRGTSYAHTTEMTVKAAVEAGFETVNVKERRMTEADVESGRVGERGRKWVGIQVWYGLILRRQ